MPGAQNPMAERLIRQIAEDNRSGAAEILRLAAEAISLPGALEHEGVEGARRAVIATCAAVVRAQPDMAPLVNLSSASVRAALAATRAGNVTSAAASAAREYYDWAARALAAALPHAAGLILEGTTIMTHSRSSSVLAALKNAAAAGARFGVIATESRPMLEGRALAEALAGLSISVTLIADAAAALALERAHIVLIGADRVTPEDLVSKVGTRLIALAARERGVPVYAICDTSKFTAHSGPCAASSKRSADELWADAPQGVEVFNAYFEPTPLDYFAGVITEDGVLRPEQVRPRARAMPAHPALLDALGEGPA
jgi:translation initiation factor 2B subunit (eIF-2B alpha/beta/delta family)